MEMEHTNGRDVFALLLIVDNKIIEHRIQDSLSHVLNLSVML